MGGGGVLGMKTRLINIIADGANNTFKENSQAHKGPFTYNDHADYNC